MTDLPKDFSDALNEAGLGTFFADCTEAHRREYLKWIAEAKRLETRRGRIKKAVSMISDRCAQEFARAKS